MAQWEMSQVAREGNNARGRGAVNFRFRNPFLASTFVREGWDGLVSLVSIPSSSCHSEGHFSNLGDHTMVIMSKVHGKFQGW